MADKKSAEDPADKPANPKTLDSFDPLRDAETLLDESAAPDPADAGQGGADEEDTRFDAG